MPEQEPFPVYRGENFEFIVGESILKGDKIWSAVILMKTFNRPKIALYTWVKNKEGKWKRKQKFTISRRQWPEIQRIVEYMLKKAIEIENKPQKTEQTESSEQTES